MIFPPIVTQKFQNVFQKITKAKLRKKNVKFLSIEEAEIILTFSSLFPIFFDWKVVKEVKKCKGDANGVKKTSSFLILHLNILRETNIFAIVLKIRMKIVFCFVFYFLRSGKSGFEQKNIVVHYLGIFWLLLDKKVFSAFFTIYSTFYKLFSNFASFTI